MTSEEPKQTYRGNCHCGAFVYEVRLPEIKSAVDCNCSICSKKGALWVMPAPEDFKVVKGAASELSSYNFGSGNMTHKFCGNCATEIMVDFPNGPPGMKLGLNVRSIQDLDIFALEKKPFDGASLGDKYTPHAHKGSKPAEFEGGKAYTGSCHCGDVTFAVFSNPMDETWVGEGLMGGIVECNCSICARNGYVWIKPPAEQVVLAGDEDKIGRHVFNYGILAKTFCKRCGVPLTNECRSLSDEELAGMAEIAQYYHKLCKQVHPVNARVIDGLDLTRLQIRQVNGAGDLKPADTNPYVNP
ncbi:Centromere protein V [Colletotrichum siamense]|nr:Centromere protein V [Colletotrichum siamense]KAJ5005026.1 Centromere protein V [Colletotrichum sp. SAR 10_66]